jgi:predicted nucleic acid-binding protein
LGIKQRTGQMDADEAAAAWRRFQRLCTGDLHLLGVDDPVFHRAASLLLDPSSGLRAGDAVQLAAALAVGATQMATLDGVLARNAEARGLDLVVWS